MKIFTGPQIKAADRYTIANEPVSSIELMERAAEVIAQAICTRVEQGSELLFFVGKGNNGGDGLAVARMLANVGFRCSVCMLFDKKELSEECLLNFERLPEDVVVIDDTEQVAISEETIIIDAILGSGAVGDVSEPIKGAIEMINSLDCEVISLDLPSGMKSEFSNDRNHIVRADCTLTLQFPKLAMLLPESGECCGDISVLPIELHEEYIESTETHYHYIDIDLIQSFSKKRLKYSHKGDYGHAFLICGTREMCGAAILSAGAALRSGCGLVTAHIPKSCATALYASAPSAMVSLDKEEYFTALPAGLEHFTVCGIGCGLGQQAETARAFEELLRSFLKPMVIDADALNIIASRPEMKELITPHSILTPHPGELKRLVGEWGSEEDKIERVRALASEINSIIVVKGAHTMVCMENGDLYFNSTGSPAMSKGGSGDVLTGFITGLMARGYAPHEAALLGVYVHGVAGEKAAEYYGVEGMNSGDMIDFLGEGLSDIG